MGTLWDVMIFKASTNYSPKQSRRVNSLSFVIVLFLGGSTIIHLWRIIPLEENGLLYPVELLSPEAEGTPAVSGRWCFFVWVLAIIVLWLQTPTNRSLQSRSLPHDAVYFSSSDVS
jgi:hypothetical protein